MRVQVEDAVLLGLGLGVGRGLPGLVVPEPDALLVENAPELTATDGRHDPLRDEVPAELGQAPVRERLAPVSRTGEGHLHDLGPLVEIDPDEVGPRPSEGPGRRSR